MSSKQSSLVKEVQRYWDMKTQLGKSMKKVAEWGDKHPATAVPDMLHRWSGLIAKADIGKAKTFEIGFEERPAPAEKHCKLGNCLICGTSIRYGTRVSVLVNGKKLNFGEVGDLVGEECFDHMTYIAEAAGQKNFKMYEVDSRQREKQYDKLAKLTLSLGDLAPKIVKKLEPKGFDLDSKILAEVADDVQKKASEGDFSAIKYETDKGKTRNMIGWALANKEKIYDPDVRYTVALLAQRPDLVKPEQWAAFILYQWQERPLKAAGELGGIKEDIFYLSNLPSNAAVIQKYGKVDLEKVVEPVKAFNKARWEEAKLGELLKRDSVTKAQSRAVKYSVAGLHERREYHNRETINSYCTPEEFNKVLVNLREKVNVERNIFAIAKAKGVKEPDMPWKKDTWKSLRDFFELEERVRRTDNTVSTRDVFLNYVFMENADSVAKTLYTEGKKVELAGKKGNDVLGRAYSTIKKDEKIDKLLYGAIDFISTPKWMKTKIRESGMNSRTVKKLVEDVKETYDLGLIPTKYIQPDGEKSSMLERAMKVTADFTPDDGSTAQKIGYLRQLEDELKVEISRVRAEDGKTSYKKSDPKFNTKTYEGKKYFSKEQKDAVNNLFNMLSTQLTDLDIPQAKKAVEEVEKFYEKHTVYSNLWLTKEQLYNCGVTIKHKPFKDCIKRAEQIQKFNKGEESNYIRLNQQLKERIMNLRKNTSMPRNIEEVMAGDNVLLTKELVKDVDARYQSIARRVILEGGEKYENPSMNYFDIAVIRRGVDDNNEDHRIRSAYGPKRNNNKPLLKWTPEKREFGKMTIEPHPKFGTWYGRGRPRDYVEKLCAKAEAEGGVYLQIVNARK